MLNSKAEWGGSRIPRLTVEVGAKVKMAEYQGGGTGGQESPSPTAFHQADPQTGGGDHLYTPSPQAHTHNPEGGPHHQLLPQERTRQEKEEVSYKASQPPANLPRPDVS